MKFTIAAGILTQVLPAVSERSPSKLLADAVTNDHHVDRFALSRALKSVFPRGGSETIGYQSSQPLDGELINDPFSNVMMACDPSSNDPDIGILSCDPGYECVFDQDSTLGGFCTSISRDLQEPDPCYLCGDGSVMSTGNFDLPVTISGYTGMTCGVLAYFAYANVTLDSTRCGPAGDSAKAAGCCAAAYDCDLCGGEGELLEDAFYDDGLLRMKCGQVALRLNETACAAYAPDIAPSCCGTTTTSGSVVPTPAPVADVAAPSAAPETPAPPTSASAGRWSTTSALVSMMSLTVVTAAGSLLLN